MNRFGDHTPKDDMYGWIEYVKEGHNLTTMQMIVILLQLVEYMTEDLEDGKG